MSVVNNNLLLAGDDGYVIDRSVRLRSSASAYFNRTFSSGANETTSTLSLWVKRGKIGAQQTLMGVAGGGSNEADLFFDGGDTLTFASWNGGSRPLGIITTSAVYRDPSAWYHIVFVVNTTTATANDRLVLYVNGVRQALSVNTQPSQNAVWYWNGAYAHRLGAYANTLGAYLDGYLTEVNFIDGQALTPSSFGETDAVTGVWKPKKYAGTYGTNGFYLNFSDPSAATAAAIGKDYSGNGNNWTPNNISVTAGATYDSMIDTPTPYADGGNGRGNYAVMNPIWKSSAASTSNANLTFSQGAALDVSQTTMGVSSGKWYWETTVSSVGATPSPMIGVVNGGALDSWTSANGYYYFGNNGQKYNNSTAAAYGATYTTNDVIGVALDLDAGTLTFYKNNVSQGTAYSSLSGTFFPAFSNGGGPTPSWSAAVNFGQRPFAYTPPTGFKALNTQNLPEPTIVDGSQYFDVSLFTGTGSAQVITNSGGMQPDLVWVKGRGEVASNRLVDSVRGVDKVIYSNLTNAETTEDGVVDSFNLNGFTGGGANAVTSGYAGVAWQWKANGAGVSNTDGSITSTVSAGVTQGFSVVTWTTPSTGIAYTIGHGLGVVPSLIIMKERTTGSTSWVTHHKAVMSNSSQYLLLNTTGAIASATNIFGSSMPSSTVFGNTSGTGINVSAQAVAYCFAEVPGFSKFGSYTGNGSTDGPFVHLGFRPAYVMIKVTNNTYDWEIADSSRSPDNFVDDFLVPNSSAAENANVGAANSIDFLSNGFKIRANWTRLNDASGTFIYMAFAEHPFKHSLAR